MVSEDCKHITFEVLKGGLGSQVKGLWLNVQGQGSWSEQILISAGREMRQIMLHSNGHHFRWPNAPYSALIVSTARMHETQEPEFLASESKPWELTRTEYRARDVEEAGNADDPRHSQQPVQRREAHGCCLKELQPARSSARQSWQGAEVKPDAVCDGYGRQLQAQHEEHFDDHAHVACTCTQGL